MEVDEFPEELDEEDEQEWLTEMSGFFKWRLKIDKKIQKLIASNDIVNKIIKDNLKDLNRLKDSNFQNISKLFIKD